jgi:hypothetical protein
MKYGYLVGFVVAFTAFSFIGCENLAYNVPAVDGLAPVITDIKVSSSNDLLNPVWVTTLSVGQTYYFFIFAFDSDSDISKCVMTIANTGEVQTMEPQNMPVYGQTFISDAIIPSTEGTWMVSVYTADAKGNSSDTKSPMFTVQDIYPYTGHVIEYIGLKGGLTSSSTDHEFAVGLNEVMESYLASHPDSLNEIPFDGVTYELTNSQTVTGGVPNYIWDLYWEDINEYSYSIGSCWVFVYAEIPSKGGTGTVYVLYTIVTNKGTSGEVRYKAVKAAVSPK